MATGWLPSTYRRAPHKEIKHWFYAMPRNPPRDKSRPYPKREGDEGVSRLVMHFLTEPDRLGKAKKKSSNALSSTSTPSRFGQGSNLLRGGFRPP